MAPKENKVVIKRKKFIPVEIPILHSKMELIGNAPKELVDRTIKIDMTRQLKGKSVELIVKVKLENEKAIAHPSKVKLLSYFIRRMIRKRISYVEDSFDVKSQESLIKIKPFLITKRKVSRSVRKTLRNKTKNWIEDYVSEKKDSEVFTEMLSGKMQRTLSLVLKKTYPLSLCEIRTLELIRTLKPEEVPKIKPKAERISKTESDEPEVIDQLKEIEDEKIRKAEKEIKDTQEKASQIEEKSDVPEESKVEEEKDKEEPKKSKKTSKKPKEE